MPMKPSFLSRLFAVVCASATLITLSGLIVGASVMSSIEFVTGNYASHEKTLKQAAMLIEVGSTLSLGSVGCFVLSVCKDRLDFDSDAKLTHLRCTICKNYVSNPFLRCAINPALPPDCSDFESDAIVFEE